MSGRAFVYVIGRERGPVKVGISSNPHGRLETLQTGCPFKLELLRAFEMRDRNHALEHEQIFHDVHEQTRLIGEWFKIEAYLAIESVETSLEFETYFAERARREGMQ